MVTDLNPLVGVLFMFEEVGEDGEAAEERSVQHFGKSTCADREGF